MKLSLTNIKQHANYTLDLPDTGMVLLKGPSGCGKTSILEAIRFGLYDSEDVLGWGKTSASLSLEWRNRTITRTVGPDSLSLSTGEKDAAAQSVICTDLGMSVDEFLASSYIQQDGAESLLNLRPTAQLSFIQRLVSGDLDIEKIREKARGLINLETVKMIQVQGNLTRVKQEQERLATELSGISGELENEVKTVSDETLESAHDTAKSFQSERDSLWGQKESLTRDMSHPAHKFRAAYNANKANLTDQISKLQNDAIILETTTTEIEPWSLKSREEVGKQRLDIKNHLEYLNFIEEFKRFKKETNDKYPETVGKPLITALKEMAVFLEENRYRLGNEIGDLNIQLGIIRVAKEALVCPSCSSALKYDGKKLVCLEEGVSVSPDQEPGIQLKINELTKKQRQFAITISEVERQLTTGTRLQDRKAALGNIYEEKTKQELEQELDQLDIYVEKQNRIEASISIRKRDLQSKRLESESLRLKLKALESQVDQYAKIADLDTIRTNMDTVDENLSVISFNLQKANDIVVALAAQRHAREIYDLKVKARDKISKSLDLQYIESAQIQASLEEIESSLAAANKVYDVVRKASVDSVADILVSINANAAYYVGKMFPEGETSVIIRNSKQLKNGDEKPDLSVVITHKGSKVKKLKSLSGGEKARLTLAFQLALSNLYKSPLLLVDEACSGLDAESMERCFDLLKEVSSDKLVILVEHGAPEHMFDTIVEVL